MTPTPPPGFRLFAPDDYSRTLDPGTLVWACGDWRQAAHAIPVTGLYYATALPPAEPTGWRIIEEAPRDGTRLLLWVMGETFEYCDIGHWCQGVGWVVRAIKVLPSHFQPLPQPPTL